MLHRIKMENVERGRRVTTAYMDAMAGQEAAAATAAAEGAGVMAQGAAAWARPFALKKIVQPT